MMGVLTLKIPKTSTCPPIPPIVMSHFTALHHKAPWCAGEVTALWNLAPFCDHHDPIVEPGHDPTAGR